VDAVMDQAKARVQLSSSQHITPFGVVTPAIFKIQIIIYGRSCGTHSCCP
jgi:hypothetical protein